MKKLTKILIEVEEKQIVELEVIQKKKKRIVELEILIARPILDLLTYELK